MSVSNLNWSMMKYYRTLYMKYYRTYLEILLFPFVETDSKLIFFPTISEKENRVVLYPFVNKGEIS